jgi:gliding motility associated protien GldN
LGQLALKLINKYFNLDNMKKLIRKITSVFILVFCSYFANAQNVLGGTNVLDGVYVKEHVPSRKPIPYNYLREADMMWTKKIWRMLDLREKQNFPLYYPKAPVDNRMSLIDLIVNAAEKGMDLDEESKNSPHLVLYNAPLTVVLNEFSDPKNPNGIADSAKLKDFLKVQFGVKDEKRAIENPVTGNIDSVLIKGERKTEDVYRYIIKEEWYFDKQRSKMEVRIIGLCPIRLSKEKVGITTGTTGGAAGASDEDEPQKAVKLFWVYFPALRPLLANHEVFNPNNDAERRTFDDIFFKRKFSSFIIQETNVYDNRTIAEYAFGLDAQLEAEKVKDYIFKLEHDLWEY